MPIGRICQILTGFKNTYTISLVKKILVLTIAASSYLILVPLAFAQIATCPSAPFAVLCFQEGSIPGIIGAAVTFIFLVGVIIALFFLLGGGVLKLLLGGGDKISAESARNNIVAAIVGLIILFLSFLLINILLGFFNVNIGTIAVPKIPTT